MMISSALIRRASSLRSVVPARFSSSSSSSSSALRTRIEELLPAAREDFVDFRKTYGNVSLGETTVGQAIGGMRGIHGLISETSLLDAEEGIEFRGYTIPELQEKLPAKDVEPLPEGLLWLLLTGEVPNAQQVASVTADLQSRAALPEHVTKIMDSLPRTMHPMTQLCVGVNLLQTESKFAAAYRDGKINKFNAWETTYEDSMDLLARLPEVASRIYTNVYRDGKHEDFNADLDWGANFASMLGFKDNDVHELMRMYLTIHSDHEGGNVSAHATHLVGSALADPYLSYSAGMSGLAGPLHGLANQEVLRWLLEFKEKLGGYDYTREHLVEACWDTLNSGRVIPGYGHAVLRKTDPRYTCQREFAQKFMPNDPLFKLVSDLYDVVPGVLTEHGKTQNPWPNVDAHSGVLLQHYGLVESDYYTVLFGVSRAIGVLSNLVINRSLGMPIERPKSMTTAWVKANFKVE